MKGKNSERCAYEAVADIPLAKTSYYKILIEILRLRANKHWCSSWAWYVTVWKYFKCQYLSTFITISIIQTIGDTLVQLRRYQYFAVVGGTLKTTCGQLVRECPTFKYRRTNQIEAPRSKNKYCYSKLLTPYHLCPK